MNINKKWALGMLILLSACEQVKTEPGSDVNNQPLMLENQVQRISYIFGMDSARNIKSMDIDFDAKAFEQGLRTLTVQVKGPGSGRETALRSLQSRGFKILSIKDTTPMPHNGARPPKRRRV